MNIAMRMDQVGRVAAWLLLMGFMGACGSGNPPAQASADSTARHDVPIVSTTQTGMQLFTPYNYVLDFAGTGTPCVQWANQNNAQVQVTNLTTSVAVNYVTSLSQLEQKLGVDVSASAKADTPTSISGAGQLTSSYTQSLTKGDAAYTYLLTASQTYDIKAAAPIKMMSQPSDPTQFLQACGDSFVQGLRFGASANILMTIDAPSQTQADSLAVAIGGNLGAGPASGNVSTNNTSSNTSSMSQYHISFTLQTVGFNPPNVNIPTASDATGVAAAVTALGGYMTSIATSIQADMSGDAKANGALATRNAIPVNVIRGFYSQTSGYDTTHDVFATINPLLDKARTYINDLGYLQSELYDIYYGEIEAFMNAADQSRFNVAGTASSPLPTAAAVGALVTQQEAIFRPTGGSGMLPSNVTSAVHGLVYGCLEGAQAGTYAGCNSDPTSAPAYQSALAALDNYAANARVLPMHFTPQGDARFYGNCSGLTSQTQVNMSLITEAQATALAPYIATDPDQCAWYGGGSCTGLDYPYYDATQSADACGLYGTRSCAILCIPPNGLFATAPQLGTGTIPPSPTGGAAYPPPSAAPAPQPLPQGMDPTAPAPDSDAGATCTDPPTCMSPSDCCSNSCTNGACDPVGGSDAGASDPDAADPDAGQ